MLYEIDISIDIIDNQVGEKKVHIELFSPSRFFSPVILNFEHSAE